MPQITLDQINKPADGRVLFRFGKYTLEFPNIAAARDAVRDRFSREDMMYVAMALCFTRQPNLDNPGVLEGRTLDVNLSNTNWGRVV